MAFKTIFVASTLLFSSFLHAAELRAPACLDMEKLYTHLEKSYNRKAPILAKAGWGKLGEWEVDEFESFRSSVLQCKEQGFFKKLDPTFLQSDLDKKMVEMKKESTRIRDDKKIAKTLAEYQAKITDLSKNLDEGKAAELRDMKDMIQRITGIDDSSYFNQAAALQNRIDLILKSPRKKLPAKEVASQEWSADEKQLQAREADPERFKKCETLNLQYQSLVIESLALEKKTLAEKEVGGMKALGKRKDEILHEMESASIQLREKSCKKFFTPQTSVK